MKKRPGFPETVPVPLPGRVILAALAALAVPAALPAVTFELGFEGCPAEVSGQAGEVKTFDVFATLATGNNASPDGAEAWQLSLTADGGTIRAISLDGIVVSTIFDDDGDPLTPPVNPDLLPLAGASFRNAQLATFPGDGRSGAVSAVLLGQELKRVLQPSGTVRVARITVEAVIPSGNAEVPLTLRFEDGFQGTGQPVKNKVTQDGVVYNPTRSSCTVILSPLPSFALGFEGCPGVIEGRAGEMRTFDVFATLQTSHNTLPDGAQAWQASLTAVGGTIRAIELDGVVVQTIHDDDGLPGTPDLQPYPFDLADASFGNAQLATFPADGRHGAVSAVVLGQDLKTVLLPDGAARVARITVEAQVPTGSSPAAVTLRFEDGFRGTGQPVKNKVTLDGVNYNPDLGSCTTIISPLPTVALGFEGCPSVIRGQAGEVKTFEVFAALTTSTNVSPDGAQAWSMSLSIEGGTIKGIGVDGLIVPTTYDDDADPVTPPINPYDFDLKDSSFKSSQLATHPDDGRQGAVSAIVLGQDQKTVLVPNGTFRVARILVEAVIPAGAEIPLTLRFEDGFQGTGQPVKNKVTFDGVNFVPSLGSCTVTLSSLPAFSLGFDGCPPVVSGAAGETKTFDVFASLETVNNPSPDGAQAWSLSLTADGGTIKAITVDGVKVSTIFDADGDPVTPPQNPFLLDLKDASFKSSQLATFPADGRKGAVSAIVLGQELKTVLQPNGTARLARITVEAVIPTGSVTAPLNLRFESGFKGTGQPVKNVVTIDGVNFNPILGSCSILLSSLPATSLGFEGCPAELTGTVGETRTFDVFATLSTSNNSSPEGAQAWSLSLTADGGTIQAISVDGVQVSTIFDDDGDPLTPPRNPYLLDLKDAAFKSSQLATFPADGRKGAVSAVVLGQEQATVLQPNGTARLARITVEAVLPSVETPLTLRFEDGFRGTGQPVRNLATFEGVNFRPTLGSCTVRLAGTIALNQVPGDCNQDGTLDISDGICELGYLFTGVVTRLPCGDGTSADPGSLALVDTNGDGGFDLSDAIGLFNYLFLGGLPHVRGVVCTAIAGCPDACN